MSYALHRSGVVIVAAALLAAGCGGSGGSPQPGYADTATVGTPAKSGPPSSAQRPSATPSPSAVKSPATFAYQPLYPFASLAQADAWQASYAAGGHQPWHRSAELTALAFTQGYLGFRQISKVASHLISGGDARVTVGLRRPDGTISQAAAIHLVKYGTGRYAPWEVVGTDDTTLIVHTPAYGAAVSSPVTVGGTITGVDENLRAEARTLSTPGLVGNWCCRAAGGQASPWSLTMAVRTAAGQVLTIVVHTGGHYAAVERFAVTGVRAR
jgi:hypothetical protein